MTAPALHSDRLPAATLPHKARPDRFMCAWGVFDIALYPWMPARWLAYQKAGLAYPGIDALFRALADMLRIEQSRDVIPTGELTLTAAPVFDETDVVVEIIVTIPIDTEIVEKEIIPVEPPPEPEIAPTPVSVAKRAIPERTTFTFSSLLQKAKEKPFFYILAPAEWLTDFHITPDSGNALYFTIKMYARDVTRVEPEKIKVELFHTGEQAERRLEIIAACRKWEAQREKVAA